MQVLTKAQRKALKQVFDRGAIYPNLTLLEQQLCSEGKLTARKLTYRQFRRGVQPTFGMDNAITIKWAGMWLAIETDGYCHS